MNIDEYWRAFVVGPNHTILAHIIQKGIKAFFEFVIDREYLDDDPKKHSVYRAGITSNDLSSVGRIFSMEHEFKGIGKKRMIGFPHFLRKHIGYSEYQEQKNLGDEEWAKKLYKKSEDKAEACYEFRWLAECLCENLGDRAWAKKVYKKAEDKAKDPSEFNRLTSSIYEKLDVASVKL